jgi:putative ABC transport system substrate-binding protein
MLYGPNIPRQARQAAAYVDKILKGAKPSDLPVEQPTTFDLIVNLRTAKQLGIELPASLLLRAETLP